MLMEAEPKRQYPTLKSFFTNDKQRYTFYFDLAPNNPPTKIDVYLEARMLTEDALLFAIDELNKAIRKDKIELVSDVKLYKPRLVGRNFKPKTDLPCLSLYQKICDLKIEQIAVQIPNREKAIRQIKQQIQASKEAEAPKAAHPQETNKVQQQSALVRQTAKQLDKKQIKQNGVRSQQKVLIEQNKDQSKNTLQQVVNKEAPTKEVLSQAIPNKQVQQVQPTSDTINQVPEQPSTNKPKQQPAIRHQLRDTHQIQVQDNLQQPRKVVAENSKEVATLLRELTQQRRELSQLRKQIAQQKKDIRQERKDLREQRSELRKMRKQLSQQRLRLQHQRKELSQFIRRIQEERKEWQQKKNKNKSI